jgi:hypothetical protein
MNYFRLKVLVFASSAFFEPNIVNVFPEPVYPYIKMAPLIPFIEEITISRIKIDSFCTFNRLLKNSQIMLIVIVAPIEFIAEGLPDL